MLDAICQEFCAGFYHFNGRTHVVMENQYIKALLQRLLPHGYVCELVSRRSELEEFCDATFTKATRTI